MNEQAKKIRERIKRLDARMTRVNAEQRKAETYVRELARKFRDLSRSKERLQNRLSKQREAKRIDIVATVERITSRNIVVGPCEGPDGKPTNGYFIRASKVVRSRYQVGSPITLRFIWLESLSRRGGWQFPKIPRKEGVEHYELHGDYDAELAYA